MGLTEQDQQSREAYEDGKWYWVEHEGWHGEPPTIAPACYKAECDAWYSYIFSGISTPYLKVLEPCELQAARALPAGMEPLCYLRPAAATTPARAWQAWENDGTAQPVYTAAQVQAMGRVPPGWQAVPVQPTGDMLVAIMSAGEVDVLRETPEKHQVLLIDRAGIPDRYTTLLAAAPRPPVAQDELEIGQTRREAESLAWSLFNRYYAKGEDYTSGRSVFGLCDSLRGVLSQIDNMTTGLVREPAAQERKPLTDEQIENLEFDAQGLPNSHLEFARAIEAAHGIT